MSIGYMNTPITLVQSGTLGQSGPIVERRTFTPIEVSEIIVVLLDDSDGAVLTPQIKRLGRRGIDTPENSTLTIPAGAEKGSIYRRNLTTRTQPAIRLNIGDVFLLSNTTPGSGRAEFCVIVRRAQQTAPVNGANNYFEVQS